MTVSFVVINLIPTINNQKERRYCWGKLTHKAGTMSSVCPDAKLDPLQFEFAFEHKLTSARVLKLG